MSINLDLTNDLRDDEKRILAKIISRTGETVAQVIRRTSLRDAVRNEANQVLSRMVETGPLPEDVVVAIEAAP